MKNKTILPIVILLIISGGILYFIFSNKVEVDEEGGVTTKKDTVVTQEVSYEKDGTSFKFTKNRVTKTADMEMQYAITDEDEFQDFLDNKVTMVPFLINLFCGSLNQAFYDPEKLLENNEDASEAAGFTEDSEFKNALEDYKITNFIIEFTDKESNEPIASCQSSQKGFENISFTVVRDYSGYDSFLGHRIGEP